MLGYGFRINLAVQIPILLWSGISREFGEKGFVSVRGGGAGGWERVERVGRGSIQGVCEGGPKLYGKLFQNLGRE